MWSCEIGPASRKPAPSARGDSVRHPGRRSQVCSPSTESGPASVNGFATASLKPVPKGDNRSLGGVWDGAKRSCGWTDKQTEMLIVPLAQPVTGEPVAPNDLPTGYLCRGTTK